MKPSSCVTERSKSVLLTSTILHGTGDGPETGKLYVIKRCLQPRPKVAKLFSEAADGNIFILLQQIPFLVKSG